MPHCQSPTCSQPEKPESEFYSNKARKGGLDGYCKECRKAKSRVSMAKYAAVPENKAKMRERDKVRVITPEQKARHAETGRAWAAANPEKAKANQERYREKHREAMRERDKQRREANPDKVRVAQRKYHQKPEVKEANRQRMRGYRKTPAYRVWDSNRKGIRYRDYKNMTEEQWLAIVDYFESRCAYCETYVPQRQIEMEHMLPRSRDGKHEAGNVVPACRSCNAMKHDKTPHEWARCAGVPPFDPDVLFWRAVMVFACEIDGWWCVPVEPDFPAQPLLTTAAE